jgi:hypothetical protein
MKKSLLLVLLLFSFNVMQGIAQNPEMHSPPPALYIVREDIKPGMMGAHNKHSANYVNIFKTLQTPNHRIALVPVAGSENEVVYLTAVPSFAELERMLNDTDKKMGSVNGSMRSDLDRLDKEAAVLHAGMRDMLAVYRPDLSFNPNVDVRTMRYFSITTTRIRPGHDAQYVDYITKVINTARQKAKVDSLHVAVYQVISGGPNGTYIVFRPMRSLAEMDVNLGMRVRAAMGDDARKDADKAVSEAVISSETSTYWMTPAMSYVDKEFAAGDPTFWNTKTEAVAKPKPKMRPRKPNAPPPPAN